MVADMRDMLRGDAACESLLECFHGLKRIDREVFGLLMAGEGPLTVDEIAAGVDRERSTAYRSVQRLMGAGIVHKEQVNYDQGGYYHVYRPADPEAIADEMQRMLNDWYAQMGQLIATFRDKYGEQAPESVAAGD